MDQQRIWAPWRLDYIAGRLPPACPPPEPRKWMAGADHDCFLCRASGDFDDEQQARRELLVADQGPLVVTILNRYPYTNGHLLVSPRRHVSDLAELSPEEHLASMERLAHYTDLYRRLLRAEGFNVGLNLGKIAGAGVPGHLHWHLVPRWSGDGNFMATIGSTRVIPQSLDALWEALIEAEGAPDG